jgi:hypothetical protein
MNISLRIESVIGLLCEFEKSSGWKELLNKILIDRILKILEAKLS